MCDECECVQLEKCSIKGFTPVGWCCEKCEITSPKRCEKTKDLPVAEGDVLVSQLFKDLEKKIAKHLKNFKKVVLLRAKR